MLKLKLRLDGKITSVNKVYNVGKGRVFLNPEVKAYRAEMKPHVEAAYKECGTKYEGGILKVSAKIYTSYFTKGGEVRRVDVDNTAKQILDTIFPALKIDDSFVFELKLQKVNYDKGQPYITVEITEYAKKGPATVKGNKKVSKKL